MDLQWPLEGDPKTAPATSFRLEEKVAESEWQTRYEGLDLSSVRTGLSEGIHQFRVFDHSQNLYSDPLIVEVRYMDAARVRILLILGGIVVLATVIAIIHGHLTHRKEDTP